MRHLFHGLLTMRPSPRRWPVALRVAVSTAITIGIGWAAGDLSAGLVASLGAFTAAYGSGRPYFNRGIQSAVIALALAFAVTVGVWAAPVTWLAISAVSVLAVGAVWLCAAFSTGPPGAFVFPLVCAAGVGVSASHLLPWQVGLLVLGGGIIAWFAQMSAVLVAPRGPEKAALAETGAAIAGYLESAGAAQRHRAAAALAQSWTVLVDQQPYVPKPGSTLQRLRKANHALALLFADGMRLTSQSQPIPGDLAELARAIGTLSADPDRIVDRDRRPLPPPSAAQQLARTLAAGSHTRRVMLRVAIAAPLAGICATLTGVGHVYWAMAAGVLVLAQGAHRIATVRRGVERVIGTLAGLGLAAAILAAHPTGLWLILVIAVLQFSIEMFVVRNYVIATVFITSIALTISSGTHRVNVADLVLDRGADTLIGCAVGVLVYLLVAGLQESSRIADAVTAVFGPIVTATSLLARGQASSIPARNARRDLQTGLLDLAGAAEAARSGSKAHAAAADKLAPVVAATEHLGYLTLAASWLGEASSDGFFGDADPDAYVALLKQLSTPFELPDDLVVPELPPFAAAEVRALVSALRG